MDALGTPNLRLIDELSAEHAQLLPEIERIVKLGTASASALGQTIAELTDELGPALDRHIAREDDLLFPAFAREPDTIGVIEQFALEHREIKVLRDQLMTALRAGAAPQELARLVLPLSDLLSSHMAREDMMLFPSIRARLS